jgi:alkylation response protein AidB-like acyl-CoA dehydrogenase
VEATLANWFLRLVKFQKVKHILVSDNVRQLSAENVLGNVDKGAAVLMSGLDLERLVCCTGVLSCDAHL